MTAKKTDGEPVGVATYKAENAKNGWNGRGLAFDGGCLNLSSEGAAEFVFRMDETTPLYEEGRDYLIARIPADEIEFLRDYLMKAFPAASPAGNEPVAANDPKWGNP